MSVLYIGVGAWVVSGAALAAVGQDQEQVLADLRQAYARAPLQADEIAAEPTIR